MTNRNDNAGNKEHKLTGISTAYATMPYNRVLPYLRSFCQCATPNVIVNRTAKWTYV
jgi:hypothetical protein